MNKEFSAFSMDAYFDEQERKKNKKNMGLDKQTQYDLLLYDFIQKDFNSNPWSNTIGKSKLYNVADGGLVDYCMLVHTNLYNISVIKRKVDSLPDNNSLMPARYSCVVMNKHYFPVDRPGEIVSRMLYQLFDNWERK